MLFYRKLASKFLSFLMPFRVLFYKLIKGISYFRFKKLASKFPKSFILLIKKNNFKVYYFIYITSIKLLFSVYF